MTSFPESTWAGECAYARMTVLAFRGQLVVDDSCPSRNGVLYICRTRCLCLSVSAILIGRLHCALHTDTYSYKASHRAIFFKTDT